MALDELGANIVTAIDGATDVSKNGMLCYRNYSRLRDEVLTEFPWSFATAKYESDTDLEDALYQKTITGIVEDTATQITVTTSGAHGWTVGKAIEFKSIVGATELNNVQLRVASVPLTTTATFVVETADLTAYVSGGTGQIAPLFGFAYAYALPSDFLQDIRERNQHFLYEIDEGYLYTNDSAIYLEYIRQETDPTKFSASFIKALSARLAAKFARPITGQNAIVKEMWELYYAQLGEAKVADANRGSRLVQEKKRWIRNRRGGDGQLLARIER